MPDKETPADTPTPAPNEPALAVEDIIGTHENGTTFVLVAAGQPLPADYVAPAPPAKSKPSKES